MKKKKWIWLILGIVVLLSGIGGGIYMTREKENEQQKLLQAQKEIALYIVRNYHNIAQIDFDRPVYSKETGVWSTDLKINKDTNKWIVVNFITKKNTVDILSSRFNENDSGIKKELDKSRSLDTVIVNYGEMQ